MLGIIHYTCFLSGASPVSPRTNATHSRSRASAEGERGSIVHLKPDGYLCTATKPSGTAGTRRLILTRITHERNPVDILTATFCGCPVASSGREILKACKTEATLINNDASARCLPKHILRVVSGQQWSQHEPHTCTHRRP